MKDYGTAQGGQESFNMRHYAKPHSLAYRTTTGKMLQAHLSISDQILHALHHERTHRTVVALLVVDVLLVLASIALEIEYLTSQKNQCDTAYKLATGWTPSHGRRLVGAPDSLHLTSLSVQAGSTPLFGNHVLHGVEHNLALVSISILGLFLFEQLLAMGAMR